MTVENYCIGGPAHYPERQMIKVLYRVEADEAYDVTRWYRNTVGYIAVLTVQGEGVLLRRTGQQPLRSGELFLVPADDVRGYHTQEAPWCFYWFEFDAEHLPLEVQNLYQLPKKEYHLELCDACLQHMQAGHWDCASALFTAVMHLWHVSCGASHRQEKGLFMDQAIGYMKQHLEDMSVRGLAEQMHVNERTLRNLFYRYIGSSPIQVFNRLRMEAAAEALTRSHKSIGDIAEELGFSSQFYFSKAFRQVYHVSPRGYRNALNQRTKEAIQLEISLEDTNSTGS